MKEVQRIIRDTQLNLTLEKYKIDRINDTISMIDDIKHIPGREQIRLFNYNWTNHCQEENDQLEIIQKHTNTSKNPEQINKKLRIQVYIKKKYSDA